MRRLRRETVSWSRLRARFRHDHKSWQAVLVSCSSFVGRERLAIIRRSFPCIDSNASRQFTLWFFSKFRNTSNCKQVCNALSGLEARRDSGPEVAFARFAGCTDPGLSCGTLSVCGLDAGVLRAQQSVRARVPHPLRHSNRTAINRRSHISIEEQRRHCPMSKGWGTRAFAQGETGSLIRRRSAYFPMFRNEPTSSSTHRAMRSLCRATGCCWPA